MISSREINPQFREGKSIDEYVPPKARPSTPGGPGFQWRMMKLRRVYETAEEEGKSVEEVALDRFGTLEAFEEAKEEKRILDEREGKRVSRQRDDGYNRDGSRETTGSGSGEQRYMFTDIGSPALGGRNSSFRRPGSSDQSRPSTPGAARPGGPPAHRRLDSLRLPSEASSPATASAVLTPIPTVVTPPVAGPSRNTPVLSTAELNRMQAKVLKAKLMGNPDAERLEQEYEAELAKSRGVGGSASGEKFRVEMLPTIDAQGRLYDVGKGKEEDKALLPGNRKKKEKVRFQCDFAF